MRYDSGTMSCSLLSTSDADTLQRQPEATQPRVERCSLLRYADGNLSSVRDSLVNEGELEILAAGQESIRLYRTPGQDIQLVLGTLLTRGIIRRPEDVADISFSEYELRTQAQVGLRPQTPRRLSPVDLPQNPADPESEPEGLRRGAERLFDFRDAFEQRQRLYRATGAMHGAALFTRQGKLLTFAEDIGRHNAFDKAIGEAFADGTLARAEVAVLSSRLALELIMKAAMAGITILAGLSVATNTAVELADARGITLVGRLRSSSMNIYTHPWRLHGLSTQPSSPGPEAADEHRTLHLRGIQAKS
ncbi:MAG: formate dehydrogenase accessory sulfurtransferase FdhD [Desulfovibrionaceae bacterium]